MQLHCDALKNHGIAIKYASFFKLSMGRLKDKDFVLIQIKVLTRSFGSDENASSQNDKDFGKA